ncbi:hypothetical protein ABE65_000945 [Fictibacillus phosphorivorans]|uniref:DUF2357 domain-containing protein n=1 Tax=Fictibacillus phosphorivorans TaxID=1221500 RepID=A0A160II25_9BACL|nr:DUF2357 domain-containing protein [Fictibacillus phosphorivorans]ANC75504.1 hypothetical protein ABE65_000945 [Fictibacillus phosphorivorans]
MGIPLNEIPFTIEFSVHSFGSGENKEYIRDLVTTYANSEIEAKVDPLEKLVEFKEIFVNFKSNSSNYPEDAALYIDGIDVLENLPIDENEITYIPPNQHIKLFNYSSDGGINTPWIPGCYRISVKWENKYYYSIIKIFPKNMSEDSLDIMRLDLENVAMGLARGLLRRKKSISRAMNHLSIPESSLDGYFYLKTRERKLFFYLDEIINSPLHDLNKKYQVRPFHKVTKINNKTNKWMQSDKGIFYNSGVVNKPTMLLTPVINIDNNTTANLFIKYFLEEFIITLNKSIVILNKIKKYYENNIIQSFNINEKKIYQNAYDETINLLNDVVRLTRKIRKITNNNFFIEIKRPITYSKIPLSITRDNRYKFIYETYKEIKTNIKVDVKALYDFQWKSSDLIYEYWCYLKIIETLIEMGYKAKNGWIFDLNHDDKIFLPSIPDGTCVLLEKDNSTVKVFFNQRLPLFPKQAKEMHSPIWSRSPKNKPDVRMDVYLAQQQGTLVFSHSLIFDAKYRPSDQVWNLSRAKTPRRTEAMFQLSEYVNKIVSTNSNSNVVKKVIAICPTDLKNNKKHLHDENHNVILVNLSPGDTNDSISEVIRLYL